MVWDAHQQLIISFFIERLQPCQLHRATSGLFTKSNLTQVEYSTKHVHFTIYKYNLKVSPFSIALRKKWQIKQGDAGTIDRLSGLLIPEFVVVETIANLKYYLNAYKG